MTKRVAICAGAQTPFVSDMWYDRFQGMAFDCVDAIVRETGVTFDERDGIGTIVTCSDDVWDARTISDNAMTDAVGAHFRCEEKVAMDGINAIGYGLACILSGHTELVLVVGHCKESQPESRWQVSNLAFDPFFTRPVGLDALSMAALQARAYMGRSGVDDGHLARVVARSRACAAGNPSANARTPLSEADVLASPLLCDPVRELHVHPVSDGAVALLLASEERARALCSRPVFVSGFGNCMDSFFPGERDLAGSAALARAASRAYAMAGITDPRRDADVIEVSDAFAHELPLYLGGLGLHEAEEAPAFLDGDGLDRHHVNTSGGTLAGSPTMIAGMARALEVFLQLRGEAAGRQVVGARRGIAHGATGPAGQHQAVLVMEVA